MTIETVMNSVTSEARLFGVRGFHKRKIETRSPPSGVYSLAWRATANRKKYSQGNETACGWDPESWARALN